MSLDPHDTESARLHLPRILCLHGGGTNATIFSMQCRVLRRHLRPHFRLVFAEGPFSTRPGSDVISVYAKHGPFKAWLRTWPEDPWRSAEDITVHIEKAISAAMNADDMRGATGPWAGLLGFSQGAKVAASLLYLQQIRRQTSSTTISGSEFRFAVLVAGRGPLVWLQAGQETPPGLVDACQLSTLTREALFSPRLAAPMINTPTIHVHGLRDPGLPLHRKFLAQHFNPHSCALLEWDGGHRMAIKTADVVPVVEGILAMARATGTLPHAPCYISDQSESC
ncbi:hypothetical protein AC579_5237 [Pseudocercospora musae]|uniref:Serine hydrolase domain-containing protein n=1 Tax=Pseudocercospora musae TaxID=113226 RepID=A0A139IPK9_9PEZI|nr:hypothetical protein AC579_5237 [Pseudocercospora musae]